MKLVAFVRERRYRNQKFIDYFRVDDSVKNVEEAFRAAVADYLKTEEAKPDVEDACGEYNWGDAMGTVPEEFFNKHGIYTTQNEDTIEIFVNQDEILFPELQAIHLEKEDESEWFGDDE